MGKKQKNNDENNNNKDSHLINTGKKEININAYNLDKDIKILKIIRKITRDDKKEIKSYFNKVNSNYINIYNK